MADAIPTAAEPSFREQVEAAETADAAPETPQEPVAQSDAAPVEGEETQPKEEKLVPLAALHQERAQAKELKRQLREQQTQMQAFQQQQLEMMRYMQAQQMPQQQVPDEATDPLGFQSAGIKYVAGELNQLKQQQIAGQQQAHQAQQFQQFVGTVDAHEQAYAKEAPDYFEAINWAKARKVGEYEALGISPQEAKARVEYDAASIAHMALTNGESPAEVGYRLAKQMGYRRRGVSDEQKLQMQKAGQAAALPGGSAGGSGGGLSLDALAKLSGSDFLEATKGDNWRKVMSKQQ